MLGDHALARILQPGKKPPPLGVDRPGVVLIAGVKILHISGVGAVKEGTEREGFVELLLSHVLVHYGDLCRKASRDGRVMGCNITPAKAFRPSRSKTGKHNFS